jgi:sorbitol-specific phosphotransferase system component IIC
MKKSVNERLEVLMRIVVLIVSGIVLGIWRYFIVVLAIINYIVTLVSGERMTNLARMSEIWNTQMYIFLRYVTMVSNERPFPFEELSKDISKVK